MAEPHLSPLQLDTLRLGGLPEEAAARAQAHLEACEACRQQVAEREAREARFRTQVLPLTLPALEGRLARTRWFELRWALGLATAAALLLAVLLARPRPPEPVLAYKGGPGLAVVARRAGKVFPVRDGAALAPGDELRFVVEGPAAPWLLLGSVDGAGQVSVYFPFGGAQSGRVEGPRAELPGSVVLDRTPGPERVFALFSQQPLSAEAVRGPLTELGRQGPAAIRAARLLPVPGAQAQLSFAWEKAP